MLLAEAAAHRVGSQDQEAAEAAATGQPPTAWHQMVSSVRAQAAVVAVSLAHQGATAALVALDA